MFQTEKVEKSCPKSLWMDGRLVPWDGAQVHVATNALHYATAVIDGVRIYNGKPFLLKEHLKRLLNSADILCMQNPYTLDDFMQATHEVLEDNHIRQGYLRPILWLGDESLELSAQGVTTHGSVIAFPTDGAFGLRNHRAGLRVLISSWARPAPHTLPVLAKCAATYPVSIIARHEAQLQGCHDALLLDYRGLLAEATGANLFLVIDGNLHTPIPECFLNGLTRQVVMELAIKLGIKVIERAIHPDELKSAEEVFLTGTAYEIMPLREILDVGEYPHGPITKKLQRKFHETCLAS